MPLQPGGRLGPYEITAKIGEGGMGEVWRARDTKLDRDVAIKILPEAVAADPERLARFEREAKTLAALNHPNIAHIYGLEGQVGQAGQVGRSSDAPWLIMELVEGPTLADLIAHGHGTPVAESLRSRPRDRESSVIASGGGAPRALSIDEALPIAKQIAEALEAAHEQGIIHRDLKPANVKVRPDGAVKVLDFGLAKALEKPGASGESGGPGGLLTQSPTITTPAPFDLHSGRPEQGRGPMTAAGIILGTAAYMSPEQARGKPVDKRADIWAFGCVLFEMLTGRRAFDGDDTASAIAQVLEREPDLGALPASVGPRLRELLRRCLEKDRRNRWHDIADVRLDLNHVLDGWDNAPASGTGAASRLWWAIGGAAAGAVTAATLALILPSGEAPGQVARFVASAAPGLLPQPAVGGVAMSPDGRRIAYAVDADGAPDIYVRDVDRVEGRLIPGRNLLTPFFSPDGSQIGFYSFFDEALMKMSAQGGPSQIVAKMGLTTGASWGPNGVIVVSTADRATGLLRVSADGGLEPTPLTTPEPGTAHLTPYVLPGGDAVLFTITPLGPSDVPRQVAVLDLASGRSQALLPGEAPQYASTGHLLFLRDGGLFAVAFNADRLVVQGEPALVLDGVGSGVTGSWGTSYSLSRGGSLAFVTGPVAVSRRLVWVSRNGTVTPIAAEPRAYENPVVSPDGTQLAIAARSRGRGDIFIWDVANETLLPFTQDGSLFPVWTPDGARIAYTSVPARQLLWKAANNTGVAEPLGDDRVLRRPLFFSVPGDQLVFEQQSPYAIGVLAVDTSAEIRLLLQGDPSVTNATLSPDGRWMAYQSSESGRSEIYVRSFPDLDDELEIVSGQGGLEPVWSRAGDELFYVQPGSPRRLMGVTLETGSRLTVRERRELIDWPYLSTALGGSYDVAPDGRFVAVRAADQVDGPRVEIILNWLDELTRLVPTN